MALYLAHNDVPMPVLAGETSSFEAGMSLAARINDLQPSGY